LAHANNLTEDQQTEQSRINVEGSHIIQEPNGLHTLLKGKHVGAHSTKALTSKL
jgi:hypothetical protein